MTAKSTVAVLYTQPETVLEDYQRLFDLAGGADALDPTATTILKDNISWHYPMPSANTTPWQVEGTVLALQCAGFDDLVCVQNKTVVTRDSRRYFRSHGWHHRCPWARSTDDGPRGQERDPGLL